MKSSAVCIFVSVLLLYLTAPVFGADTLLLRMTAGVGINGEAINISVNEIEKASEGRIKFKVFPFGARGGDRKVLEQVRMGGLDLCPVGIGLYTAYDPKVNIMVFPFMYDNYEHLWKVLNSPVLNEITSGLPAKGLHPIVCFNAGFRCFSNNKRLVNTVGEMDGIKIRIPKISSWITVWKSFGASPVSMAVSELYMALKTGVVDAQENSAMNFYKMKLYEVQKYFSEINYAWMGPLVTMNEEKWKSIPADLQDIIIAGFRKGARYSIDEYTSQTDNAFAEMKAKYGLKVNRSPDLKGFRAKAKDAYKVLAKEDYYDQALIDKIRSLK